jgi:phosphoesterase RecJ-like protein
MTGLLTDTIGFQTSNMTPDALRMAADLMEMGVDLPGLYRQALTTHTFPALRLWGAGLTQIKRDGKMIWTALTIEDRKGALYPGRDDADLINLLVSAEDTEIALIFLEQPGGDIKVSWRSRPGIDVSEIAVGFGGGGHPNAAGATIDGTLAEVQKAVIQATHPLLKGTKERVAIIH